MFGCAILSLVGKLETIWFQVPINTLDTYMQGPGTNLAAPNKFPSSVIYMFPGENDQSQDYILLSN